MKQIATEVHYLSKTNVIVIRDDQIVNEVIDENVPRLFNAFLKDLALKTLILKTNMPGALFYHVYDEYGLGFYLIREPQYEWIIGPFLVNENSVNCLKTIKMRLKTNSYDDLQIADFLSNIMRFDPSYLRFFKLLITEHAKYNEREPIVELKSGGERSPNLGIAVMLDEDYKYVQQNYRNEKIILEYIKVGDVDQLRAFMKQLTDFYMPERVPHNIMRNNKNKLIILNTLATRKAIEGGLDIYLAHQISTKHGLEIERATTSFDIERIAMTILENFTIAVRDLQNAKYSNLVRELMLYLNRHVTEPLSLDKIAKELFVTKEHIARLTKKETGQTINELLTKMKMLEAEKLLEEKTLSITEIAYYLGYSSPSHFSAIFMKINGCSPRQYAKLLSANNN